MAATESFVFQNHTVNDSSQMSSDHADQEPRNSPIPSIDLPDRTSSSSSDTILHAPVTIPEATDVVIIGAGPTGLTLACELARRGISFLIFDINPRPNSQSRAMILHARTLEILADLGIAQAAVLSGHIVRGIQTMISNVPAFDVKFSGIDSPFPFALILEQLQTERLLIDRLAELGHEVLRPFAVWKVEIPATSSKPEESAFAFSATRSLGSGLITSTTMLASHTFASTMDDFQSTLNTPLESRSPPAKALMGLGEDQTLNCIVHIKSINVYGRPVDSPVGQIRCRYVIGCDGARSCVRKAAGIDFVEKSDPLEFLLADISVAWGAQMPQDRLTILQNAGGGLMCIPTAEGRWRIMCCRKAANDAVDQTEPITRLQPPDFVELQQILETLVPGTILDEVFWTNSFCSSNRLASTFKKSAVLLLGDSAHMFSPTFCQGINTGIQDAYNLGWKLAAVVRGTSSKLLETFELERRQVIEDEMSKYANNVLESLLKNKTAVRCMVTALSSLLSGVDIFGKTLSRLISQTELVYSVSPIIYDNFLARGAAAPGSQLRDASVIIIPLIADVMQPITESPTGLIQYVRGGQHTLILTVHVLPPGTKAKTIFGCERNEEAVRWNITCLERLAKLARLLDESFKGRETEVAWGGLKVIWVVCGLVNFKSPSNTVGMGHVKNHMPHRLKYYFLHGSKIGVRTTVAVDYEGEVHTKYGLRLADPDGLQGTMKSGAFILVRPDGHICSNGYAGDSKAISTAFDYALTWFTD